MNNEFNSFSPSSCNGNGVLGSIFNGGLLPLVVIVALLLCCNDVFDEKNIWQLLAFILVFALIVT